MLKCGDTMDIQELRTEIDVIDDQIVCLLAKRLELVRQVGIYKINNIYGIRDRTREDQILQRINHLAREKELDPEFVKQLFQSLFTYYVAEQAKLK